MQQGKPLKAQVEVRIWGEDISKLKAIGSEVDSILRKTPGTAHVRSDFHEDYYALDFRMKPEAQRLGFTNEAIALQMYSGFTGAPVTTIREGDNNVTVLARLDTVQRSSVSDIRRMYLTSPVTGKAVPFDQIAEIVPVWQNGRIMHRSGICVLTIESETDGKVLASEILKEVKPQIAGLYLPEGYSITYGGEEANQNDTFPEMVSALGIGLLLIFFILLLQFRDLKETFVILLTIPLSVFGAMLGLWVTGNNFGFTAFVGVICLSGIVVRNSIHPYRPYPRACRQARHGLAHRHHRERQAAPPSDLPDGHGRGFRRYSHDSLRFVDVEPAGKHHRVRCGMEHVRGVIGGSRDISALGSSGQDSRHVAENGRYNRFAPCSVAGSERTDAGRFGVA